MPRKEKSVWATDAETDPFKYGRNPKPFVWGLRGPDGEYNHFWGDDIVWQGIPRCTYDYLEYLQDIDNAVIYAHNGGKFDFFFLLPFLDPEIFIINGRIAKATLFDGRIELRDSWLILPLPLSAHDKGDIDYAKMEHDVRSLHKEEILKYLRRDCDSLHNWVSDFRDNFGGGLTLAGSAFKQLKKTDYPFEQTSDFFDTQFRPYYYGGRVQCIETGAFNTTKKYYDINSAYPKAMTFRHWVGQAYRETLKLPDIDNGSWYAAITAKSRGALPYRFDNKLYFPDDNIPRKFYASGWEINTGLETGTLDILSVERVYRPRFTADFCEYVDKFYKQKLEADGHIKALESRDIYNGSEYSHWQTKRMFAKLMLNACYGKFGQDGRDFEKFILCDFGDYPDSEYEWSHYSDTEFLKTIYSRPDPSNRFYNVATAASITAWVRAYLWEHITTAVNPVYCDTDSIICDSFSGKISSDLGDWECEATLTETYIAQRKMYAAKTDNPKKPYKVASKGVRLTFDQIKRGVLTGENVITEKEAPAYSLKYGARFFTREIDFKNVAKNACNNPPDSLLSVG